MELTKEERDNRMLVMVYRQARGRAGTLVNVRELFEECARIDVFNLPQDVWEEFRKSVSREFSVQKLIDGE